jgi:hypothetical protein
MPTIAVDKAELYRRLEKEYSPSFPLVALLPKLLRRRLNEVPCARPVPPLAAQTEFDQLCFDFGIELDEDVRSSYRRCSSSATAACAGRCARVLKEADS